MKAFWKIGVEWRAVGDYYEVGGPESLKFTS